MQFYLPLLNEGVPGIDLLCGQDHLTLNLLLTLAIRCVHLRNLATQLIEHGRYAAWLKDSFGERVQYGGVEFFARDIGRIALV